jgi:asparagine synthase (glutamine-hydrolysing)
MMAWDFQYYLPDDLLVKVDRATMFYGVECREPFLDHRLVEFAAGMPMELKIKNGATKYPLRNLLSKHVPNEYFERKKQGFSVPIFEWFSKELDIMFQIYFNSSFLKRIDFLNATEVQREYQKYLRYKKNGKQYNVEKMWRILSFILWWEKYKMT